MVNLPPLAFGFGNLAMLGWLAAAAAPILIHLWMRHRHRDVPWAAMEFLRAAIKRNARRFQLQQWLLLAVRTLLLLLLALAAAKPYLSDWAAFGTGRKVHRVLVLDGSMSMQYQENGQTRFERGQQLAAQVLDQARPDELFSVCLMADPPEAVVTGPVANAQQVAGQLSAMRPTFGTANLNDTLALIEDLISAADADHRDLAGHEVLLFTDLAKSTWQPVDTSGSQGDQPEGLVDRLKEQGRLTVVDVGQAEATNTAISRLTMTNSLPSTNHSVRLECDVTHFGDSTDRETAVELIAGGVALERQTVSVPSGGSTTVAFEVPLVESGWQEFSVRADGDSLPADDQRWLAINVADRVRVLVVEGAVDEGRYLEHALSPGGPADSPINAQVVPEGALVDTPLGEFDCLFLCNVGRFTQQERELLDRYVQRGGGLVLWLGDRVLPDEYNDTLAGRSTRSGAVRTVTFPTGQGAPLRLASNATAREEPGGSLLPATLGGLTSSSEFGIDPLGYQHPLTAAFRGREQAGLLSTPVARYFQLQPARGAEVALALVNGDPLLVTHRYGRGTVAMLATAATLDTIDPATGEPWTLLPAWPSFLPIVQELVVYCAADRWTAALPSVGETISGTLPPGLAATSVAVTRPDGRTDTVPVERPADDGTWHYRSTNLPGSYTIGHRERDEPLAMVPVNIDPAESDLTRLDPASLPPAFALRATADRIDPAGAELVSNVSVHRWLLYAALGLLLLEPILARWLSGRAA